MNLCKNYFLQLMKLQILETPIVHSVCVSAVFPLLTIKKLSGPEFILLSSMERWDKLL
jgi:hypothetical protein